jgi:hypothetical protein
VIRSAAKRRETGPRPPDGFGQSLWLIDAEVGATAEATYEAEVPQLAYGAIPSFGQVCERVTARAELLQSCGKRV